MNKNENNLRERSELDAIGERIRKCRKTLKLQQKAMAQAIGISASYFNEIELGKSIAGGEILLKLSKTYKMNVEYLVTGNGEPFTNQQQSKTQPKPTEDEFILDKNIDTTEKLFQLMEKSSYARMAILIYATRLVTEQEDIIRKTLKESPDKDD